MTIEDLLVQQGESWRAEQSAVPSMSALLDTVAGSDTQLELPADQPARRSRTWLPALVAAVVLALVGGTFALVHKDDRSRTQAADSSRACTSKDLKGVATPSGAWAGPYVLTITMIGVGDCRIGNEPPQLQGVGITSAGGMVDLVGHPGWTVLHPYEALQLEATICGKDVDQVEVDFPSPPDNPQLVGHGNTISVSASLPSKSPCADGASGVIRSGQVREPGTLTSLVPHFTLKHSVRSGDPLNYQLIVYNPTDWPVSLRSCPPFTLTMQAQGESPDRHAVTRAGSLDCSYWQLPPHGATSIDGSFDTTGVPPGRRSLTLTWSGQPYVEDGQAPIITVT